MLVGVVGTLAGIGRMSVNAQREMCVVDVLTAEKTIDSKELRTRAAKRWAELMLDLRSGPDRAPSNDDWVDRIVQRLREDGEIEVKDGEVKLAEPTPD